MNPPSLLSSPPAIRETVAQARQAVTVAERAVQVARDEATLAATAFNTAMRYQMEAAIDRINRVGMDALTDEMIVEVIAHYLSKGHKYSSAVEPEDEEDQRHIIHAVKGALKDTHPWVSLYARRGVVIEVELPLDGDYSKAMPTMMDEFFTALDRYVTHSDIDADRRPVILFLDDQGRTILISSTKDGKGFTVNPTLMELETPIMADTFEEVVNMLPSLVQKMEEVTQERQVKRSWWSAFSLPA